MDQTEFNATLNLNLIHIYEIKKGLIFFLKISLTHEVTGLTRA